MSGSWIVEEEHGTYRASQSNPHQGYYAGDFSNRSPVLDGFARAVSYSQEGTR